LLTMGTGGLLLAASALSGRFFADRGAFLWSVLIATPAAMVLAGCAPTSPYSGQTSNLNPNQKAGVPAPASAGQAAASASQPSYTAPTSAAPQDYSDSLPYPKQSLADLFRGSTQTQAQSQTQTVPHPPSTYTAARQPYTPPPGQPDGAPPAPGASTAAAPPANPDPTDSLPYPKQSLIDLFSNK
jgi:hypothetical protein